MLQVFSLISRPSRQGVGPLLLPITAFACVTALLSIVLGGAQSFWHANDELAETYRVFTVVALVLMIAPLISLGSAAAKLSARRRDDRLAALRLIGATSRNTAGIAILEAAIVAFLGAIAGALLAAAVSPLVGLIHFRGEALGTGKVLLPISAAILVAFSVIVVAILSAAVSLRRVTISPLGVALKQQPARVPWFVALIAIAAILAANLIMGDLKSFQDMAAVTTALGVGLAITLFAIDAIGAWVLSLLAKRRARVAQTPIKLLAARAILESPRAAWRQVSGVAISSFVAVFAGAGIALLDLADSGPPLRGPEVFLLSDIRTGVIITVVGTFIMVACTVGVSQAAQILDRQDISRALHTMGTPLEIQEGARTQAALSSLLLASLGSAILAAILIFPLVGAALVFAPLTLITVIASVVLGCLLVVGALRATKPLLRQVATGANPRVRNTQPRTSAS